MNHVREIVFMAVVATAAWALLLACCRADEYRLLAIGVMAMHAQAKPSPTPAPVNDRCENCGGTGRLGDGTVSVVCPECDGTGKRKPAMAQPPARAKASHSVPKATAPAACPNGQCAAPASPQKPNPRARWFIKR